MAIEPNAYEAMVIREQLRRMDRTVKVFLERFQGSRHRLGDEQRTLIFFPGGLGSELARADQAADAEPAAGFTYQTAWFDAASIWLFRGALVLQMNGTFDSLNHIVVADGPLTNILETPYADYFRWCEHNDLDLLTVGWDFRRSLAWNVRFFLHHLVPYIQQRSQGDDPFARATVVGHSFGGMVAKGIVNQHDHPFCRLLEKAITVGCPFYGYPGQTERLFKSDPLLGCSAELEETTLAMATMPGGYTLFFLDNETYDANDQALATDGSDGRFPLDDYPSKDLEDPAIRVDPYAFEQGRPNQPDHCRYPIRGVQPPWPWFENYLQRGREEYRAVARNLDRLVREKFHCIRGVQTQNRDIIRETPGRQRWGWFDTTRSMGEQLVVRSEAEDLMPGDGVQPAWTARLVSQPENNVHTVIGEAEDERGGLEHGALMDHAEVRRNILQLVRPRASFRDLELRVTPASLPEFRNAVNQISRISTLPEAQRRAAFDAFVQLLGPEQSGRLMKRWFIELQRGSRARVS